VSLQERELLAFSNRLKSVIAFHCSLLFHWRGGINVTTGGEGGSMLLQERKLAAFSNRLKSVIAFECSLLR